MTCSEQGGTTSSHNQYKLCGCACFCLLLDVLEHLSCALWLKSNLLFDEMTLTDFGRGVRDADGCSGKRTVGEMEYAGMNPVN